MPTPVSSTSISTRRRGVGAAGDLQRAAVGHRLAGVEREVQQRLAAASPGSALISGSVARALDLHRDVAPLRLRRDRRRRHREMSDGELHRLQLQLVGPRELQEADDDLVEPPDLARR